MVRSGFLFCMVLTELDKLPLLSGCGKSKLNAVSPIMILFLIIGEGVKLKTQQWDMTCACVCKCTCVSVYK